MQYSALYLTCLTRIPEVFSEITAGSARYGKLVLVLVCKHQIVPGLAEEYRLLLGVLDLLKLGNKLVLFGVDQGELDVLEVLFKLLDGILLLVLVLVLLGTGGLVRAYTQAAQACVESAGLARMELTTTEYCELPYPVWDKFRYAVDRLPVKIGEIEYGTAVNFMLYYKSADKDTVFPCLMEASDRKLETVSPQEMFFPWEIEPSE